MPRLDGLFEKIASTIVRDDAVRRASAEVNDFAGFELDRSVQGKPVQEKSAQEKSVQEKSAQEKASQEKSSQEKSAQEKSSAEKPSQEKPANKENGLETEKLSPILPQAEHVNDAAGYWQKTASAGWQSFDFAGRPRESTINGADLAKVEDIGRGCVRLQLKDGSEYTERSDGSLLHHTSEGKLNEIKYPDGSLRKFEWDGAELKGMIQPDGKLAEHQKQDDKHTDQWKLSDGTIWNGRIQADGKNGDCKIASATWPESVICTVLHTDGSKEELRKDGTRSTKFGNGDQVEFDSSGHPLALVTADGVKREFAGWSLDLANGKEQPTYIKVTLPKSTQVSEWHFKEDKWQSGSDSGLYSFNVNPTTGEYSFRDNDSGELKRFVPGKCKETNLGFGTGEMVRREFDNNNNKSTLSNESGSFYVEINKSAATKIVDQGRQRFISRDDKGQVTELRDTGSNTLWKQNEKNEWTASALDPTKPFKKPEAEPGKSRLVADGLGLCAFISGDGSMKKLGMDSQLSELSASESLRAQMNTSDNLQAEGKQRLAESIKMIESRSDLNEAEKTGCFHAVQRLVSSPEKSSYSQSDREVMAAQTLWHLARPNRQEQGQHPTCNVTTVRSALIHESPADFARMVADIGTSDKFKTADGNVIEVPASMVTASGPDLQFPPTGGNRSWISHISDVAMANAYWQRQTTDTYGQAVPKGSLKYLEIEPQYNGDNGERLYRYADGKVSYELRERGQNTLARTPELYPADILEVMSQITAKPEKGRVIANKSQYPDVGAGVAVVENQEGFDKQMRQGPWPKIIAVHTSRDPFWQDSGFGTAGGAGGRTGGWHVVVATGYDSKTGRVAVDNSWQPERDHNGPSRQISTKMLYESTIGPQA